MQSGKVVEWLKKEGEAVRKGEPILVVEGEKTTFEVEAPESGVLTRILVSPGTDVQVAEPLAIIGEPSRPVSEQSAVTAPGLRSEPTVARVERPPPSAGERVVASPAARKLAQEHGIDLSRLTGTGPGGRISREDVLSALQQTTISPLMASKPRQPAVLRTIKLEGIRKAVAERLSFSARTTVPVTLTMEADATKLIALKDREDHISFTAFAVKAVAKALEKHPTMNASIEADEIKVYSDINIAVAINTEQGLVAPMIEHANSKTVKEISGAIEDLATRAKENRLTVEDLTGSTFTITNLGGHDIDSFAPVINPPQCAILGLGRIAYKPVAVGERIVAKPMTLLTLVFDHRIVDGVPAARFLREVKSTLEDPESLLT